MRRYTQEREDVGQDLCQTEMSWKDTHDKSPLSAGSATRHSETSLEDTHKIKSLCLQDIRRDILKHQEKIHKGENTFACRMCDKTFWNITRRYTQKKSHLPPGCTKRHSEISREETHRRKALCLQDVSRDTLKRHEKIHTEEKPFACTMYQETFWNVTRRYTQEKSLLPVGYATRPLLIGTTRNFMRRYTQDKSPLPAGYEMRHSEVSWEDTNKRKALCLQDVRRDILKHQVEIHTAEKPFACRMCDKTFWNIMRRYTQERSPMPAGVATRHFEILGEDTQRRKALFLQDVPQDILKCHKKIHIGEKPFACKMCDEKFWNVKWWDTQEKSLQDVRRDLCQSERPETSWENVHRRKTICMWDV